MEVTFNLIQYEVICHTKDCANAEIKMIVNADAENPYIICGVCEKQITDVTPLPTPK